MAGTDQSRIPEADPRGPAAGVPAADAPAIILVGPQLAENIGATARAMANCGLDDLRLVRPRDGWPNDAARPMASGADVLLDRARVFSSVEEAVADLRYVLATTARRRDMVKHELEPRTAAAEMRLRASRGERSGVLFGPERIGLTNEEVTLAGAILTVPLEPSFASLNLAQAVLLVAYEWFQAGLGDVETGLRLPAGDSPPARREELFNFFARLEAALDAVGYYRTEELRPTQVRNMRNLFQRAALTEQEVRSLHGVITMLLGRERTRRLELDRGGSPKEPDESQGDAP